MAESLPGQLELLRARLRDVLHVRLIVVDYANIVRVRILPISRFFKFLGDGERGVTMCNVSIALPMYADVLIDGLPPSLNISREFCLVPDIETIRRFPYGTKKHAICHVTLEEKENVPGQTGRELDLCPRTCLKRIVRAAEDAGISFQVGFESEVVFLSSTDPITPIDLTTYGRTSALSSPKVAEMLDEIVEALQEQEINVTQFHPESAPGQFEFVTHHLDPLGAVDALILTRETIYNIAVKYGLKATFAPKVFPDCAGTAAHCHISVHSKHKSSTLSATPDLTPGFKEIEESFIAGLLKHLRAASAFSLASTNSYERIKESGFAGVHIGWGVDNREVPLRVTFNSCLKPNSERKYHFEVKCLDGTANPYLALSAILAAGFYGGIQKELKLTSKELRDDPAKMSESARLAHGVTKRIPGSLAEALAALEIDSDVFVQGMGKTCVDIYKAIKTAEVAHMDSLEPAEQLKLIINNY